MKITATEEYGLRCLLALANHTGEAPLTIPDIARKEGLSTPQVSKMMGILKSAGLVESVRGRSGGYRLPRPAEEINVAEVFRALGGMLLEPDYCAKHGGVMPTCVHSNACSIRALWDVLAMHVDQLFQQITLANLKSSRSFMAKRLQQEGQKEASFVELPSAIVSEARK